MQGIKTAIDQDHPASFRQSTRFDHLPAGLSAMILCLLLALVGFGLTSGLAPAASGVGPVSLDRPTDADLYQTIIDGVAGGQGYYPLIVREHRARGYPLRPFFTVRSPLLATLSAMLGPVLTKMLMLGLVLAVVVAWWRRLRMSALSPSLQFGVLSAIGLSSSLLMASRLPLFHESWAALLMALSLALRQPERYLAAILAGLAAALFREMAVAFLLVMLASAAFERRWKEMTAWALAIGIEALCLCLHAAMLGERVLPDDIVSQGWHGLGGWTFYADAVSASTALVFLPPGIANCLVPLCLVGWIAAKGGLALRISGILTGYGLLIAGFARPENLYWSLLTAPLQLPGLVLAVPAIAALVANITRSMARGQASTR